MMAILAVTGGAGLAVANTAAAGAQASAKVSRDGVHPKSSVCFKGGKMIKTANIYGPNSVKLGKIDLYYNRNCKTVWGRVETVKPAAQTRAGSEFLARSLVRRITDNKRTYVCYTVFSTKACNTVLLNDKDQKSFAQGRITYKGQWYYATTAPW